MKSWMSMRRPACAPPPKIWICGIGSSVALGPAEVLVQRHAAAPRRPRGPRPSTPRAWRWRPGCDLFGVPSSSISRSSSAAWSSAGHAHHRARDLAVDVGDGALHVEAAEARGRRRAARAPRACPCWRRRARWRGRRRRRAAATSASTVGRPRLSHTRRAWHERMLCSLHVRLLIGSTLGRRRPGLADRSPAGPAAACSMRRRAAHGCRAGRRAVMYSTGDLPSTRASNRPGQQRGGARSSASRGSQSTACR